eukprot:4425710-Pyramimonas_sp.AAC.1
MCIRDSPHPVVGFPGYLRALWKFPHAPLLSLRPQYEHQRWDLKWSAGEGDVTTAALSVKKRRWGGHMRASANPKLRAWQVRLVHHKNIPALPASDWSVMRIYPRFRV